MNNKARSLRNSHLVRLIELSGWAKRKKCCKKVTEYKKRDTLTIHTHRERTKKEKSMCTKRMINKVHQCNAFYTKDLQIRISLTNPVPFIVNFNTIHFFIL